MSRGSSSEPITVPPTNNVYTGLAVAGFIIVLIGLVVMFTRAGALGIEMKWM